MVRDSLVIGHSALKQYNKIIGGDQRACTSQGIQLPDSSRLIVSNVTFVNFDTAGCAALNPCARCTKFGRKGGWPTRFEKISKINSPNMGKFHWNHVAVYDDLDSTLTGIKGASVVPKNPTLPSTCAQIVRLLALGHSQPRSADQASHSSGLHLIPSSPHLSMVRMQYLPIHMETQRVRGQKRTEHTPKAGWHL
eukprot:gene6711-7473_t